MKLYNQANKEDGEVDMPESTDFYSKRIRLDRWTQAEYCVREEVEERRELVENGIRGLMALYRKNVSSGDFSSLK